MKKPAIEILIQPLRASDRAGWQPLWQGYLDFYDVDLPRDVTEDTWRRLLDPGVDMFGLTARDMNGVMTGIVHFLFHPVTWAIAPRCYLEDLYVSPAARNIGTGRRLIEAVYAAADSRGADQVYWLTQESNHGARTLYDRIAKKTSFIKYQR